MEQFENSSILKIWKLNLKGTVQFNYMVADPDPNAEPEPNAEPNFVDRIRIWPYCTICKNIN